MGTLLHIVQRVRTCVCFFFPQQKTEANVSLLNWFGWWTQYEMIRCIFFLNGCPIKGYRCFSFDWCKFAQSNNSSSAILFAGCVSRYLGIRDIVPHFWWVWRALVVIRCKFLQNFRKSIYNQSEIDQLASFFFVCNLIFKKRTAI
jgi:hypothetical protein